VKKISFIIVIVILLMVGVYVLIVYTEAPHVGKSMNGIVKQAEEEHHPSRITTPTTKISSKQQVVGSEGDKEHINKIRNYMLSRNKSLEIYGLVVDQYNQPISDAEIVYVISYYDGNVRADYGYAVEYYKIYSDQDGRFALLNQLGFNLGIKKIKKTGYEFTDVPNKSYANGTTYSYLEGADIPKKITADSPVVLKGWKIEETPQTYFQRDGVNYGFKSGETYTINFLNRGKKQKGEAEGDLRVSFERSGDMAKNKPSWHVRLEAVNGGLVETSDTYMYQAPEDGYSSVWEFGHNNEDSDYESKKHVDFYLKSRNGQVYARLNMELIPFYNNKYSVIYTSYLANPTGSRSLYSKKR
jgi:uncharacterized protein YegP (UPF0339 family)